MIFSVAIDANKYKDSNFTLPAYWYLKMAENINLLSFKLFHYMYFTWI